MAPRVLDVTTETTCDHVDARAATRGWQADAVGVLDVTCPNPPTVRLGLELDLVDANAGPPAGDETLPPHADVALLTPELAREVAADLEAAADAAERGEATTSGRS